MEGKLRSGFTTGSCATAAAKAAAWMLLSGRKKECISIITPKGIAFDADIKDISINDHSVSCAVVKDGGDDPDVTTGYSIFADVSYSGESGISLDGGEGVGRVTKPGLDQPVGNAAINSVPREMIKKEVSEVADAFGYEGGLRVVISVPGGQELALRTFNPRLGIEGGISIIGTSGIVEPMSEQAILDTIRIELKQRRAEGARVAFISPGNYGRDYMRDTYGIDIDRSVKCSNYIGLTMDMARELGFEGILLTGHAGKLVKLAGGIMNTHSREGDCRMEIIAAAMVREGAYTEQIKGILDAVTTEEAFSRLDAYDEDMAERVGCRLMDSIIGNLGKRAESSLKTECIMYTKTNGLIAASSGAAAMIEENRKEWNG